MSTNVLDKGYDPHKVEKKWYEFWEKNHLFKADEKSLKQGFSIVIPPPNVTGVLHMGHALNVTLQDILCRYKRMCGENVLWIPGTDHAGIATQNVVEKKLAAEGLDRHKLGRKKFIDAVWEWKKEYGSAIINQLKRLGASCDWSRQRFTMDEGLSLAVRKVFVTLYNDNLIYRDNYIINWCPRCSTALSDLEVEHEEVDGHIYNIRYPEADKSGGLIVATTRPETMFGDTAVAINPDDKRYRDINYDSVILPLTSRKIPIIRDKYVDMSFGTGALKVTPAHDPNDFDIGIRHNLSAIKVIGDDGCMTSNVIGFEGLERFKCRKAVVKALNKQGLLLGVDHYKHSVGHCYRCKTIVEPNLSKQWFVKVKPLAEKAIAAVKSGQTKIVPEIWTNTYYEWMNNIKDWCISRQIWWGHQIPVWTCADCKNLIVEIDTPKTCPKCNSEDLVQDKDVLDTWFSSGLWPFSTMGWPENSDLLKSFYPTSVLVTGFDIIFFWVARMMMMGIYFMDDVPFKNVYVHALVRDEDGKKMSKSKGNVIDPLNVIEKYGTDAFRFTLAAFAAQGRDIKMSEKRIDGYRHFINKLWNAARFALMHIEKGYDKIDCEKLSFPDRWILSRLYSVAKNSEKALESYRFNDAAGGLYQFVWHEFCDWYLEFLKPFLFGKYGAGKCESSKQVLWYVLRSIVIMLHPFIPFVTEEIWEKLPGVEDSVLKAKFILDETDIVDLKYDSKAESEMIIVANIISGIRNIRGEMNIMPSSTFDVVIQSVDNNLKKVAECYQKIIIDLAKLRSLSVVSQEYKPKKAATSIIEGATVFVSLEGIIDFSKESKRLEKEMEKTNKELVITQKKLSNEDFLSKAPEQIIEKVKIKYEILSEKQVKLQSNINKIKSMES